jgi:enoyl-CoA hydratase/carnithine racemase
MSEHIKLSQHDGVLEIIFARPDKKNALTNAMYRTAREALESAMPSLPEMIWVILRMSHPVRLASHRRAPSYRQ